MKLTHAKNLIKKIIKEQEEKNKSRKLSIGKGTSGKKIYDQMDEGEFKSILAKELKEKGFNDGDIAKLHPVIWIAIGYYFLRHYCDDLDGDGICDE